MLATVYLRGTPELVACANDILFHQTADRYADAWAHAQPWWYFGGVIMTGWMPLILALPGAIPAWRERLRACDARFLLPLAWVVLVLVFFSIPAGKRDMYILPALPMFALCISPFLHITLRRLWARRTALAFIGLTGAAFFGIGLYALSLHPAFGLDLAAPLGLADRGPPCWWLLIALGALALLCCVFPRASRRARPCRHRRDMAAVDFLGLSTAQ